MSNILILHSGLEGMTNACLEVAKRLEQRDHNVYTATINNQRLKLEANSLSYVNIAPIKINYHQDLTFVQKLKTATITKAAFFKTMYHDLEFSEFDNLLESKQITGVLIDMELHEYIMYASVKEIPFLLINQWLSIWQTANNLPLQSSSLPKTEWKNRFLWKYHTIRGIIKTSVHAVNTLGINRKSFIRYLAKTLTFDLNQLRSYHFPLPFAIKSMPTISLTHPDLEFSSESVEHLQYAYPMVFEKRQETVSERFLNDFNIIKSKIIIKQAKLIVATHTTMKGVNNIGLKNLLAALAEVDQTLSIVSVGKQYSEELRQKYLPKGIYIYKSIPQIMALRKADLCIHHGGIHTINECIHFSIPMVILSGNKHDQNGCAVRVSKHGCGIITCKKYNSVQEILILINSIMTTPSFKTKIEELNQKYRKSKEQKEFEKYIESYFKNHSSN